MFVPRRGERGGRGEGARDCISLPLYLSCEARTGGNSSLPSRQAFVAREFFRILRLAYSKGKIDRQLSEQAEKRKPYTDTQMSYACAASTSVFHFCSAHIKPRKFADLTA